MSAPDIAADAWPLIDAFRQGGAQSFERLGVERAREVYEQACALNGVKRIDMHSSTNVLIDAESGLKGRLYVPETVPQDAPVILFFHGGGWVIGSLNTHDSLCRFLAHHANVRVLSVDYRLAPEAPFPAAIEDARVALRWLCSAPDTIGPELNAIAIAGDSAGGGLAAVLAAEYKATATTLALGAQVLLYPVTDLTMQSASYLRTTEGFPLTAATMEWFGNLYAREADPRDPALSPLYASQPSPPAPAFVCTVGHDPLADDGIRYAKTLASAGGHLEHIHLPQHAHGLFTSAGVIETGREVLHKAADFLREALQRASDHDYRK